MNTTKEQSRTDVIDNDNSKTFTVSIKGMDKETWDAYKIESIRQGKTMAELFRIISEKLDLIFE